MTKRSVCNGHEFGERRTCCQVRQHSVADCDCDPEVQHRIAEVHCPDVARGSSAKYPSRERRRHWRQSRHFSLVLSRFGPPDSQGCVAAVINLIASSLAHSAGPAMLAISQPSPSTSTDVGIPSARPMLLRSLKTFAFESLKYPSRVMLPSLRKAFGFSASRVSMLIATTANLSPPSLPCRLSSAG